MVKQKTFAVQISKEQFFLLPVHFFFHGVYSLRYKNTFLIYPIDLLLFPLKIIETCVLINIFHILHFYFVLDFWQREIPLEALHLTIGWDLAPSDK